MYYENILELAFAYFTILVIHFTCIVQSLAALENGWFRQVLQNQEPSHKYSRTLYHLNFR